MRVLNCNRVSSVKYTHGVQLPISSDESYWSSVQNNNNNAYTLSLSSGMANNYTKNSSYRVRACCNEVKYPLSFDSIIEAYYNCRENKKRKNECVRFSFERENKLVELYEQVIRGEYKTLPSKAFIVNYPTYREVFAADFRDRIIHHWIALRIEPLMEQEFIDDTYNCRKGKGTSYAVRRCSELFQEKSCNYTKEAYIMKWDLKGYFMSIDKNKLWKKVERLINEKYDEFDKETLLYLTREVIFNKPQENCVRTCPITEWDNLPKGKSLFEINGDVGIPIGNLTSQLLANFYLSDIDREMKKKYSGYCRYVDDCWIVSESKKELKKAFKDFKIMLNELGCKVHPKKFYLQSIYKGVSLVGAIIKPHTIYAGKRTIGKCFYVAKNKSYTYKCRKDLEKLMQSVNSYFGMIKHYMSRNMRVKIMKAMNPMIWYDIASMNNGCKIKISEYYGSK